MLILKLFFKIFSNKLFDNVCIKISICFLSLILEINSINNGVIINSIIFCYTILYWISLYMIYKLYEIIKKKRKNVYIIILPLCISKINIFLNITNRGCAKWNIPEIKRTAIGRQEELYGACIDEDVGYDGGDEESSDGKVCKTACKHEETEKNPSGI